MTLQTHINDLLYKYGSMRAVARVCRVDHAYLWRLLSSKKSNPSQKVLARLGIKRIVVVDYMPIKGRHKKAQP